MERRALLLSLGLSLLSMYLVYQFISSKEAWMKEQYGTFFPVVVATRDILQFENIRPTDIEVARVPNAMKPPGLINVPEDVIDSVAAIPIAKGEMILDNKIISKNVYSGLDTQVTLGRRAMSIPVTIKSAIGYLLRPGNRVDLAAHFEYKTPNANISEIKVFLQDLLVLAAGRTIQPEPPKGVDQNIVKSIVGSENLSDPRTEQNVRATLNFAKTEPQFITVTLEVTPLQAQTILYVVVVYGDSLIAMLRHSDDRKVERRTTTNFLDVMGPDSNYGRGPKATPPRAVVFPKFNDLVGGDPVGVPK